MWIASRMLNVPLTGAGPAEPQFGWPPVEQHE
jgi:hypothetical protein